MIASRLKERWRRLKQTAAGRPSGGALGTDLALPAAMTTATTDPAETFSVSSNVDQPSPEQNTPPVSPLQDARPTSLVPIPPTQPTATSPGCDGDLWAHAFNLCRDREPELMMDYWKHLASLQDDADSSVDLSAPRSVEQVVEHLLTVREKKQWRVSLLNKDIKIRGQVEKLARFLLWADPKIKAALSAQPYAALAWSNVSLILPLLTSATTQNETMLNGFNSIDDIQLFWYTCEETYLRDSQQGHSQAVIKHLAKLYSYIIEYQARVICHLSEAQLTRAWRDVIGWNDWEAKANAIKELDDLCCRHLPELKENEIRKRWNNHMQEMSESRTILGEIYRSFEESRMQTQIKYDDKRERDLLQDLASDYEDYKDFNPEKVNGTCEWFFGDDRFREWRDSCASRLLWVSAGPGCGKSVLSRAMIDEHRLSTNVTQSTICYFFFKDGEERRMNSTDALCAILHQLFTHDLTGNLINHALPSHKNHGKGLAHNLSELWRILIACTRSPDVGDVVCVLDALDECEQGSRSRLIDKLKDFYCSQLDMSSSSKLKFLITSRPYDDLEAYFNKINTTNYVRFDGDDKSADIGHEINLVIDKRVSEIAGSFDNADRARLTEHLKRTENRTYLWLHLTIDIIKQSPNEFGRACDIEKLLSTLPSRVSDAYEKILARSKSQARTEVLLQMLLAAARPLTLDEANVALAIALQKRQSLSSSSLGSQLWPKDKFRSVVTNLCGLFISVHDSKLSFIHQTAREFLTHHERKGVWEGRFTSSKSHSTMSLVCLSYLLLPGLDPTQSRSDGQSSFLRYAALHWPTHYIAQESTIAEQSRGDAHLLCSTAGKQMRLWAPTYFRSTHSGWEAWNDLTLASYLGLKPVVRDLLNGISADVNAHTGGHATALQVASERGHAEVVQVLLEKGADVNTQGGYHGTVLHTASAEGHTEVVQMLLKKGANANAQAGVYGTALQAAAERGRTEVVQMLLENGADVNTQAGVYGTALQAASARGHAEVVRLLLEEGANFNTEGGVSDTMLHIASERGHIKVVQVLLEKGLDVNTQSGRYGTALQAAAERGHTEVVQVLLDNGADVNTQAGVYGTALQAASARGHTEVVRLLLEKNANVNAETGMYGTILQVVSEGHAEVIQALLERSANFNIEAGIYSTMLHIASEKGHGEVVRVLLEKGADANTHDEAYGRALYIASERGHIDIVRMLLGKGADINIQGGVYGTALQAASEKGHAEVVDTLLKGGADVNTRGSGYRTALYAASEGGHAGIVCMLLEKGAVINVQGGVYGTAMQVASARGHSDIVQLLLDKDATEQTL